MVCLLLNNINKSSFLILKTTDIFRCFFYQAQVLIAWLYIFSYIWRHLDIGYVQGMCDLLAPLLVILDDGESFSFPLSLTRGVFLQLLMGDVAHSLPYSSFLCFLLSEAKAFSCFTELMKRMNQNFPHGGAMDTHFANMRSLIQVMLPLYCSNHVPQ